MNFRRQNGLNRLKTNDKEKDKGKKRRTLRRGVVRDTTFIKEPGMGGCVPDGEQKFTALEFPMPPPFFLML